MGLIPLMLNTAPGARSSTVPGLSPHSDTDEAISPHTQNNRNRPAALQRLTRRFSAQTAPSTLPMIPHTPAEWTKAVTEVKRLYLHRRYRPCSARCATILDNIKDTSSVEPAYLIYLHFYAAISMEMSARALHASSPHRTTVLRQAETHYTRAGSLIQSETVSARRFSQLSSSTITTNSSLHSPMSSVSSRASMSSTRLSSPTPSLSGDDRLPSAMRNSSVPSRRKRVTFDAPEPVTFSEPPVVRPDSPTLGFDDWYQEPKPEPKPAPLLPSASPESPPEEETSFRFGGLFVAEETTDRYAAVLADLLKQVDTHIASVRSELAKPDPSSGRSTPEASSPTSGCSSPDFRASFSSLRGSYISPRASFSSDGTAGDNEELRERIDRLRQSGWRRRRFDVGRYEALRESVLAELE